MTALFNRRFPRGAPLAPARQAARVVVRALGGDEQAQLHLAAALSLVLGSALARGEVEVRFQLAPPELVVTIAGAAFEVPEAARRLVARCEARAQEGGGAEVVLALPLARAADGAEEAVRAALRTPPDPEEEADAAWGGLAPALVELQGRQQELERLNRELAETNRGVVALYAELDEKAEALRKASEIKSRFISNVSHEFRTPISSVLSLSRLLLDHVDGPLTEEQEKQVTFIRKSAEALAELVNDLLDLAKIEAGKVDLRPGEVQVDELFAGLRGIMRPLLSNPAVALVFDPTPGLPPLFTDEGKVSQILRNLVSNALKFTLEGEVRVRAEPLPGERVLFSVSDTGVGIPADQLERIFEEFVQVEGPLQRRVKGTGLGLPLSRRLAALLGGMLTVESTPGAGSTFRLELPRRLAGAVPESPPRPSGKERRRVLVVDDDPEAREQVRRALEFEPWEVLEAPNGREGLALAVSGRPDAILLDLMMPDLSGFEVLDALQASPATRDIPVIIHSARGLDEHEQARLAHARSILSKDLSAREDAQARIRTALARSARR